MNVLIVTGEKSAENYASLLIDEFNRLGDFSFFTISSTLLENKSKKIADYRDISIIGAREALPILKKALTILKETKKIIREQNIELIVLMDFPDFNMKIARFSKRLGKRVVYYITPQVWAWRKYRISQLEKYTDMIIPILPFERFFFKLHRLDKVFYFGHPIIDILHSKIGVHKKENIILLMPGSRKSEIDFNAKVMFDAAKLIKENVKDFRFVWVYPEHLTEEFSQIYLEKYPFIELKHNPHEWMDNAFFGIVKSGTTTLEAALFGLPMVVVYRMSPTSFRLGKILIKNIKHISLPNLIAGEEIVKELIQKEANPENIAKEFFKVYQDEHRYSEMRENLKGLKNILGEYPITKKIAEKIVSVL